MTTQNCLSEKAGFWDKFQHVWMFAAVMCLWLL